MKRVNYCHHLNSVFDHYEPPPVTFSNSAAISLTATQTNINQAIPTAANPYPSTIDVTGLLGSIASVTISISNLTRIGVQDLELLLVGPTGNTLVLLNDNSSSSGVTMSGNFTSPTPVLPFPVQLRQFLALINQRI